MGISDFLSGGAGGAAFGGSVGGPWGAVIGGGVGGLLGAFGGGQNEEQMRQLEEYKNQIMNRKAPQLDGPASTSAASGFRGSQGNLISRLDALSNGTGPSLAAEQLKQATDRNMAQQQSIAQSGRGNATVASIAAANNANNFGQAAAQQAAVQRTQEQLGAIGQLGTVLGQARGQDEQNSQFNAQQQNYASQENLRAKLQTMGYNDAAITAILQQQGVLAGRPSVGDQLLAGGTGALGSWAANQRQNPAQPNTPRSVYNPTDNRNGLMPV